MRKSCLIAAGLIALVLFAWVMAHIGLPTMIGQLKAMRVALPIVLVLSAVRLLLQSITWSDALKREDVSVRLLKLAGVRLASQAVGYLTVLGPVISEPMKIRLLETTNAPTTAATLLDDGVYWFTSALLALGGIVSLSLVAVHGSAYRSIPLILVLACALVIIRRRRPVLSGLLRALDTRVPSWLARAEKLEASIRDFRSNQPALVNRMFWIDLACQILIAFEIVVVLRALHLPIRFLAVLAIEGITLTLKIVSGWIPARLGSDEGAAISAFALTGLSPVQGLSLALTRRIRDLLWALIGIMWLVWNFHRLNHQGNTDQPASVSKRAAECRQS